jgi:ribose 1,5-bisphosphokinase PhnN
LERALAGFTELDASWEAARTSLTLAEVLADGEQLNDDARQLLAKARTVFERLQSVRELARAEELAQRLG